MLALLPEIIIGFGPTFDMLVTWPYEYKKISRFWAKSSNLLSRLLDSLESRAAPQKNCLGKRRKSYFMNFFVANLLHGQNCDFRSRFYLFQGPFRFREFFWRKITFLGFCGLWWLEFLAENSDNFLLTFQLKIQPIITWCFSSKFSLFLLNFSAQNSAYCDLNL